MQNNRLHSHQGHGLMVTSGRLKKQFAGVAAAERLSANVMFDPRSSASKLKILGVLCILVLCGILVAGLWPFHAPINDVTWLQNADGVDFGSHGTLVSIKAFRLSYG